MGVSVVEYRQPQPKGVKPKKIGRRLISSAYWRGSLGQKKIKNWGKKRGLREQLHTSRDKYNLPWLSHFSYASEANTMNDECNSRGPHSTRIIIIVINLKYYVYITSRPFNLLNLSFIRTSCYSSTSQFIPNILFLILTLPFQGLIENVMGNFL